ncbi:MAG: DUF4383 domain-containing protein [Acidimicrobiia bacterium]
MVRPFAIVFGTLYLLLGMAGLVRHGLGSGSSFLFGLLEVSGLHNLAYLALGVAGVAAYVMGEKASHQYAWWVGAVLIVLGALGLVSADLFGLMPIGGFNILLHLATGVLALYFAYAARNDAEERSGEPVTER